ncbi:MAG TPA: carboxymuconolactone decarboxylase family protein [Steroidobacteraceae bacterium]|nr:carboxymuconolactone decarboxylase family protein [Steroidobacteraceae bacterium]
MKTLDDIRDSLPNYARDLTLNLGTLLSPSGAPGLSERQIWTVALAATIAARNPELSRAMEGVAEAHLAESDLTTARAAAAIMGMNNVYYRFLHLVDDPEYARLPARLRMNVMANAGVDFELASLAVSAINGCGSCIAAHARKLREHGLTREAVQSVARIAAVVHAVAGVLEYEAEAVPAEV